MGIEEGMEELKEKVKDILLTGGDPIEQIVNLRRMIAEMKEKQDVIIAYFENMMNVELVRNVKDSRLRFADKERAE